MIFNGKNIQIGINGGSIFAQSCSVTAQTPKEEFYLLLDRDPRSTFPTNIYQVTTNLSYYITGVDPIKSFIKDENDRINLNIGGFTIASGVLESYQLNLDSESLLNATATIKSYQNVSGGISAQSSKIANFNPVKWYNCTITGSGIDNNLLTGVKSFNYSYSSEIIPRFYMQSGTGFQYFTTSNVLFNQKKGSLKLTADNIDLSKLQDTNYLQLSLDIKDDAGIVLDRLNVYGNITEKTTEIGINTNLTNSLSLTQTNIYEPPIITTFASNVDSAENFTIYGSNFDNLTNVFIGNKECNIVNTSPTEIIVKFPSDLISGALRVINFGGETINRNTSFLFSSPSIEGSDTKTGIIGSYVSLYGKNFDTVDRIYWNTTTGVSDSYIGQYQDSIRSVVPDNFQSGYITVQSSQRQTSGITSFNFKTPPIINSFTPQTGIPGAIITVTGSSLYEINGVKINNISASYSVLSLNGMQVTVPQGYTAGQISITTSNSFSTTSTATFQPQIIISGISPSSGRAGAAISISGINFSEPMFFQQDFGDNLNKFLVNFNGGVTGLELDSQQRLTGYVPNNAQTGPVTIFGPNGKIYYSTGQFRKLNEPFNIQTGFLPITPQVFSSGTPSGIYQLVTITGSNLFNVTGVELSGVGTFTSVVTASSYYDYTNVHQPLQTIYKTVLTSGNDNINKIYRFGTGQITGLLSGQIQTNIYQKIDSRQIREDINGQKIQIYLPVNIYSTSLPVGVGYWYGDGFGFGVYQVSVLGRYSSQVISGRTGSFPYESQFLKIKK